MNLHSQKIEAVLFDLDDTLYEERSFFRSGFSVVARELGRRGVGEPGELLGRLEHFHHHESRDGVFQKLRNQTPFPEEWVFDLAEIFRAHQPMIVLAPDAIQVLPRLRRKFKLGCVTDGYGRVQRQKLQALGAAKYLDAVVLTDEVGRAFWKPHPLPFLKCCEMLGVAPERAAFVGDSPERDVAGAGNAGMRSIRIRRPGAYLERYEPPGDLFLPVSEVRDLFELERLLSKFRMLRSVGGDVQPLPVAWGEGETKRRSSA